MAELIIEGKPVLAIPLPLTSVRLELQRLFDPDFMDQAGINAYNMIGNLEGFEMIAPGDLQRSQFRCNQYVFATVKQEPWAFEDQHIPMFENPLGFFMSHGYQILFQGDSPKPGDVLAYGFVRRWDPVFELGHTGIFVGQNRAESKFNEGHVFQHPIEAIPPHLGSEALVFRK